MKQLRSIRIERLTCKSWVANEFLDLLTCYDIDEKGLDTLIFNLFRKNCERIDEEVVSRLATMCPRLSNLQLSHMYELPLEGKISMVNLFRQII